MERRDLLKAGATGIAAALGPGLTAVHPFISSDGNDGHRINMNDVLQHRAIADAIDDTQYRRGGDVAYPLATRHIATVSDVLATAQYRDEVGLNLQRVNGLLHIEAGFCAFDSGHHRRARHHWHETIAVAAITGDDALASYALVSMSKMAANRGNGREAIQLANAARDRARRFGSPQLSSLLTAYEAHGHAVTGDARTAARLLADAESLLDEHDPTTDESITWAWWNKNDIPNEVCYVTATSLGELGLSDAAESAYHHVMNSCPPHWHRVKALAESGLASVQIHAGHIDQAASAIQRTATLIHQTDIRSRRITHRLTNLAPALADHPTVAGVPEALDALNSI